MENIILVLIVLPWFFMGALIDNIDNHNSRVKLAWLYGFLTVVMAIKLLMLTQE